jgi:hypothetical protein
MANAATATPVLLADIQVLLGRGRDSCASRHASDRTSHPVIE